ncbi:hypothetical protein P8452_51963 [Trifolium repens]|nr:hypothetical protein P8452_51963 [Trifolium repens]
MRFVEKPRFKRLTRERKLFYMLLVDEERDESEFIHCGDQEKHCRLNWSHGATILNHCGLFFCHVLASAAVLVGCCCCCFFLLQESILCEAVVNLNGTVSKTNCVKDGIRRSY